MSQKMDGAEESVAGGCTCRQCIIGSTATVTGLAKVGSAAGEPESTLAAARRRLLETPDTVSLERARLVTEAWQMHEDEPFVVRRALALDHLLGHMTLDMLSNPVFAGNTAEYPRAWVLLPEYGLGVPEQGRLEHEWMRDLDLEAHVPADIRDYWRGRAFGMDAGIGHLAVDMHAVVHRGLESIAEEARLLPDTGDETAKNTRLAMAIACEAVIRWAARYREEALRLARSVDDIATRDALLRVAGALEQVPARPARNLFEGFQAMLLAHLAVALEGHGYSVSIGLPDRVLAPFADEPGAANLAAAFLLKVAGNSLWGSMSKTQAITIGGVDEQGRDRCNTLTLAFLDACDAMRLPDPHVFLRWHRNIADPVKERAIDMLARGVTQPLLVGDEETAAGLVAAGIATGDAWDYCVIGCNEIGVPGRLHRSATGPSLNFAEQLAALLHEERAQHAADMDTLLGLYEEHLTVLLARLFASEDTWWEHMAEQVPTPFTSALMDGAVARGSDLYAASSYPHGCLFERGLTNATDGLSAINQLVFQEHRYTLADFARAIEDDFANTDFYRAVNASTKWGNDHPEVDQLAVRLLETRERAVVRSGCRRPRLSSHVVRSLHWVDGLRHGASPDGRRRGEPYASSAGPEPRDARKGPTAVFASMRALEPRRFYRGGYNLNLTLPSGSMDNTGRAALGPLVETFFASGGQELQLSVLDPRVLREAMDHPETHPDLLVRIAGFTARFTSLSRLQQEALVRRAEGA